MLSEHSAMLFGEELPEDASVYFATVNISVDDDGAAPATYGIVVDRSRPTEPLVNRLFDPAPFKAFAEAFIGD